MNREQKLEEALRKVADTLDSVAQSYNGSCEFASVDIRYGLLRSCVDDARAALSAPKAEAVIAERDHYKNGLQILADTFYKGDQHQDYAKHVLDTVPIDTSPVPALTDEAVERAYEAAKNAMPHEALIEIAPGELERVVRTALLAAFPSKGEGE